MCRGCKAGNITKPEKLGDEIIKPYAQANGNITSKHIYT
jgi:hypothetical protein